MQFTQLLALVSIAAAPALSASTPVFGLRYDDLYDNGDSPISSTACSATDGPLGRFPNFRAIPTFPFIGGAFVVEGFNSTNCGSCWELSHTTAEGQANSAYVTVVNSADSGFITSWTAEHYLTGLDKNEIPPFVPITFKEVSSSFCGL